MDKVLLENLAAVPYLDVGGIGGRRVNLMALWDGERWSVWLPMHDGKLMRMHPVDAMRMDYVAKEAASPKDLLIPFVEIMWQHLSYADISHLISAICSAFHRMGTSVTKLRHLHRTRDAVGHATSDCATTEIEYLTVLARTVYDLLQEVITRIWENHVQLADPAAEKKRKASSLPSTFSKIVLKDKSVPRTPSEIEAKFGLPSVMAATYAELAADFAELRNIRNRLVHSGAGARHVFTTERGFCVDRTDRVFASSVWTDAHRYNENNLVSVLPWIANVILKTIGACNALMSAFVSIIAVQPPLAPGYRVFVRGPSTEALLDLLAVFEGGSPWWTDVDSATERLRLEQRIRERAYYLWKQRGLEGRGDALNDWLNAERIESG